MTFVDFTTTNAEFVSVNVTALLNDQTDIETGNVAEVGQYHTLFNSFIGTQNQIPWLATLDINGKLQMFEIHIWQN